MPECATGVCLDVAGAHVNDRCLHEARVRVSE